MSTEPDPHGLNPRQRKFVELLTAGASATQAYVDAGYSPKGAEGAASKLQGNAKVVAAIAAERERLQAVCRLTRDEALAFLSDVVKTPIGEVDAASPLCQEHREEVSEFGSKKLVKMPCKLGAIDRIAKMLGWYVAEKVEHSATDELAELIKATRAGN